MKTVRTPSAETAKTPASRSRSPSAHGDAAHAVAGRRRPGTAASPRRRRGPGGPGPAAGRPGRRPALRSWRTGPPPRPPSGSASETPPYHPESQRATSHLLCMMAAVRIPFRAAGRGVAGEMFRPAGDPDRHPELADAVDLHLRAARPPASRAGARVAAVDRHRRPDLRASRARGASAAPLRADPARGHRPPADGPPDGRRAAPLRRAWTRTTMRGRTALGREPGADWPTAGCRGTARTADRHASRAGPSARLPEDEAIDQVLALAMRPFLVALRRGAAAAAGARRVDARATARSAAASRISRCIVSAGRPPPGVRPLPCCSGGSSHDLPVLPQQRPRPRITSFATTRRPVPRLRLRRVPALSEGVRRARARRGRCMPIFDGVATLPLDAAAMQRGYLVG